MNQSVEKIKESIERLPPPERKRLVRWLLKKDAEAWDHKMDADAANGKLEFLVEEAEAERKSRKLTKFP